MVGGNTRPDSVTRFALMRTRTPCAWPSLFGWILSCNRVQPTQEKQKPATAGLEPAHRQNGDLPIQVCVCQFRHTAGLFQNNNMTFFTHFFHKKVPITVFHDPRSHCWPITAVFTELRMTLLANRISSSLCLLLCFSVFGAHDSILPSMRRNPVQKINFSRVFLWWPIGRFVPLYVRNP